MFRPEFIKSVGDSVGVEVLDDVAKHLADNFHKKLTSIIKEAALYMHMSASDELEVDDVIDAMKMHNMNPVFGYSSVDSKTHKFTRSTEASDVFFVPDTIVDLQSISNEIIEPIQEPTMAFHWLTIEGQQPNIPQNPKSTDIDRTNMSSLKYALDLSTSQKKKNTSNLTKSRKEPNNALPPLSHLSINTQSNMTSQMLLLRSEGVHVLSSEQLTFLEKLTEIVRNGNIDQQRVWFRIIATEYGLSPLIPYISHFISTTVPSSLKNTHHLYSLLSLLHSLVISPYLDLNSHLHQLLPALLTCCVATRVGYTIADNHTKIRNYAAFILSCYCSKYSSIHVTMQPRITQALTQALVDPNRSMATYYGSIQVLKYLGIQTISLCLLPLVPQLFRNIMYFLNIDEKNRPNVGTIVSLIAKNITEYQNIGDEENPQYTLSPAKIIFNTELVEVPWQYTCAANIQVEYDTNHTLNALLSSVGQYIRNSCNSANFSLIDNSFIPTVLTTTNSKNNFKNILQQLKKTLKQQILANKKSKSLPKNPSTTLSKSCHIMPLNQPSQLDSITRRTYATTLEPSFNNIAAYYEGLEQTIEYKEMFGDSLRPYILPEYDPLSSIIL